MSKHNCPNCKCDVVAPDYPVTCTRCGITYGPGGEVANHRKHSEACRELELKKAKASNAAD